jgi:hypothetical protein
MGSHAESQRHIALDLFIQIDRLFEGNPIIKRDRSSGKVVM